MAQKAYYSNSTTYGESEPEEKIAYTYDLDNELLSASDTSYSYAGSTPSSTVVTDDFQYNGLGQESSETQSQSTVSGTTTTTLFAAGFASQYDSAGNRTQLAATVGVTTGGDGTVSGGTADFVNNYSFDYGNRMTQGSQSGGNVVTAKTVDFTYFADGQFDTITRHQNASGLGHGLVTSTYAYDSIGRLITLTDAQAIGGGTTFAAYSWYSNPDNTLIFFDNSVHSTEDVGYGYDPTGQLTSATYVNDTALNATYGFDANANDLSQTGSGNPSATFTVSSTAANEISTETTSAGTTTFFSDNNGNLTRQVNPDGSEIDYGYNARNLLTSVTNKNSSGGVTQLVSYTYDAFNRLVGRSITVGGVTTTGYFVYDGNNMVLVLNGSGAVQARTLYGPAVDQILAQENVAGGVFNSGSTNQTLWALGDNQNTVRDLVRFNSGGTLEVSHITYNAFGLPLSGQNVDFLFGYTGKYTDQATGLQWNLNRWYNPSLQRWMTQDPSGLGPDTNPYRYCGNGPTDGTDPNGLVAPGAGLPGHGSRPPPTPKQQVLAQLNEAKFWTEIQLSLYIGSNTCERYADEFARQFLSIRNWRVIAGSETPIYSSCVTRFTYLDPPFAGATTGHAAFRIVFTDGTVLYFDNGGWGGFNGQFGLKDIPLGTYEDLQLELPPSCRTPPVPPTTLPVAKPEPDEAQFPPGSMEQEGNQSWTPLPSDPQPSGWVDR